MKKSWVDRIIVGIIIGAMYFLGSNVIANDKDSRSRDMDLEGKVNLAIISQKDVNTKILVTLERIQTDIAYIKGDKCK